MLGGLVAPLSLVTGCATPPQTEALRRRAPAEAPVELTSVPFFPQTPYHCGPAALATVLGHAGLPATPEALTEQVFLPAREGALQVEMLAAARRQGAVAVRIPGELDALLAELRAGHPVLVLQNLALELWPRWHYAVVVGFDPERAVWVLRSGTTERALIDWTPFESTWARSGHWAVVVLPPGRLPATAREADAVEAALGFERSAKPAQAAAVYDSVLARWPDNLVAAMGLGNTRFAAGELEAAARAFERAAQRHDSAAAWNNLAQVRLKQGRRSAARQAAQRALARAEAAEPQWKDAALDTLREAGGTPPPRPKAVK